MKRAQPASAIDARCDLTPPALGGRPVDVTRPSILDDERGARVVLPPDHPAWLRDALSLSGRAKALLAKLTPYVIRAMTFWDHRATTLELDDVTLEIDASGSYRTV